MKNARLLNIMLVIVLIASFWMLSCDENNRTDATGISTKYPEIKPLAENVGEDNISIMHLVGVRAARLAMDRLGFAKGADVLCMTSAGHAVVPTGAGYPSEYYVTDAAVDGVSSISGCTIGTGNLHMTHCAPTGSLWFAFIEDGGDYAGDCVYITVDKDQLKTWLDGESVATDREAYLGQFLALPSNNVLFPKTLSETGLPVENISAEYLTGDEGRAYWENMFGGYARFDASGNEYGIISIADVWAMDEPRARTLLGASQMHDHICPGLIAGRCLTSYLYENLPLSGGEEYHVIGCPCFCKDDYLAYVAHTTPGTMTLTTALLSDEDLAKLPVGAEDAAGIFIRWNPTTNTGTGLVLTFSFTQVETDAGIDSTYWQSFNDSKWWYGRLKANRAMMDHLDTPGRYVGTYTTFDLTSREELVNLKSAGVNPYEALGIITD